MKKNLKILYVARTHRQHDRVIDELRAIYKRRPVTGVSIRGRNEMCLNVFAEKGAFDSKSLMEVCELLKSKGRCPYYKNVENRSYEYLQLQAQVASRPYMGSEILRVCKKMEICPYELVKGATHDARVIALSYLYVFDSQIRYTFPQKPRNGTIKDHTRNRRSPQPPRNRSRHLQRPTNPLHP